jgi:hypothetical protein
MPDISTIDKLFSQGAAVVFLAGQENYVSVIVLP